MALLNRNGEVIGQADISNGAVDAGGVSLVPLDEWESASGDGLGPHALHVEHKGQAPGRHVVDLAAEPLLTPPLLLLHVLVGHRDRTGPGIRILQ